MTTSDDTSAETLAATQTDTPVAQAVFIDSRVPDLQDLIAGAQPGEKVFVLDSDQDGLDQIASDLASAGLSDLSAISIVGHGASGQMLLGSTLVDEADLASHADALAEIGAALTPGGDLSLYGCDIAEGAAGQEFIADLSAYAGGVDVAAATHVVGSADQGGSFVLDASTGAPVTASPFTPIATANYHGELSETAAQASIAGDPEVFVLGQTGSGADALVSGNNTGIYPDGAGSLTSYDVTSSGPAGEQVLVRIDPENNVYFIASNDGTHVTIYRGVLSLLNTGTAPNLSEIYSGTIAADTAGIVSLALDPAGQKVLFTENNLFLSVPYNNLPSTPATLVETLTPASGAAIAAVDAPSHTAYFDNEVVTTGFVTPKGGRYNTLNSTVGGKPYAHNNNNGGTNPSKPITYTTFAANNLSKDANYTQTGTSLTSLKLNGLTDGTISSLAVDATNGYLYFTVESSTSGVAGVYRYSLADSNTNTASGTGTATQVLNLTAAGLNGEPKDLTIDVADGKYYFALAYTNPTSTSGVYVGNLNGSALDGQPVDLLYAAPSGTNALSVDVDLPPTLTGSQPFTPTYTVGATPRAPINNASDGDPDGDGDLAGATVVISGNYQTGDKLNFTNTGNISGSYSAGTLTLTGPGTYAQYDAALDSVTFSSTSTSPATRSFAYSVSDGLVSSTTIGASLMVTVPPPNVGGGGTTVPYTEAGTAATIDPVLAVQDPAGADITGATVTISNGYFAGDTLALTLPNGSPISILSNTGGVLTLTGSASAAAYQTALQSVTFSNSGQNPDDFGTDTTRTITFQVKDPAASSGTVSGTVDITPVDNPPVITVGGNTGAFTEKASAVFISPNATVSDVDNRNFNGGSLTAALTTNGTSADQLTIANQGTAAGQIGVSGANVTYGGLTIGTVSGGTNGTSLVVSLNSSATPTATTALVEDIQFSNTSNVPSTAPRTVTYTIDDGSTANNGNPIGTATATVTVTAVDDPPSFSGLTTSTPTVYAGAAAVGLEGSGTIADPELDAADDYAGATLTFARDGGANANDVFGASGSLSLASGIVEIGSTTVGSDTNAGGTLAITFTANATTALVSEVFQDITYANTGTTAGTPQIDFTINDGNTGAQGTGGAKSATGNIVVDVVTDAPPVISGTSAMPQTVDDNATITPFTGVSITDTDTASQTVTVTLSHPSYGSLSNLGGGTYAAATGTYTATDTNANVTSDLDGLVFTPIDNQITPGTTENEGFTIASNDGSITTTDTKTNVTIASIDDPPTIAGTSATAQTVDDNATIDPFTGVAIGDVDNPAQTQTVTVTLSAPADGTLSTGSGFTAQGNGVYAFSGTAMAATTALDALVFTPTDNQIAPGSSESEGFAIASNDGAGGAASDAKTNVTITSINDQPTITGTSATAKTVDDNATISPFTSVAIGDVDNPAQTQTVTVTLSAPADGTLSTGSGFTAQGNGVYGFSGTAMAATTALDALVFTPTDNQIAPGTSESEGFTIASNDGAGGAASDAQMNVTITSIDDPPTIAGTSATAQTVDDNATIDPFNGVAIGDVDNPAQTQTVTVTLSTPADGTLSTGSGFTAQGNGVYVFSGTAMAATTALDALVFTPIDNQIAPGTTENEGFTIASNDGSITTTDTKTNVTIASIDDPPTIAGTSATAQTVDDNATISPFTGVAIGDVDNPAQIQTVTVTLSAPADGTLSTGSGFTAQGNGVYGFSGTAVAATTALDALVFTPTDNQIAPGTSESEGFAIASNDGAGGAASDAKTNVTITSIDDPSTIGGTVANQTITDKGTATPFSGVTIGDPDVGASESVTITVTAGGVASDADGTLSGAGLTETSPGSGTYTLTAASPSTVQAALRALVFTPTANQVPSGSVATGFTLSVSDGIVTPATTDSQTSIVATSVNDPPTASATATNPIFQQGGSAVALFSGASVSTIESGQTIEDLTLTVSGVVDGASETLFIDGTGLALTAGTTATTTNGYSIGVAVSGTTATVTIGSSAGATPAAIQTLIDGLAYADGAAAPTKGARDVTLTSLMDNGGTANGGADTSALSLASTVTVAVPPVVTAGGSTSYTERGMADDVAPGLTISDQNSATIASATASITSGFQSGDTLAATVPGSIAAAYDPTTGILTLTGVASVAAYQTALDSVTFASTSHDPTASGTDTSRTIAVQIDDGLSTDHESNSATTTVTVTGVDDAPVLANPTATASYVEAGAPVVLNPNLSVTDAELTPANSFAGATLTLARDGGADAGDLFGGSGALTLSGGFATVSNVTIGTYTETGGSFVLTFGAAATGADVDTALRSLTYATSGHALPASLQIDASFSDGNTGAQGTGGAKTAVGDTTISVGVAAPSAPMLAAASDTGASHHDGVTDLDAGLVFTGTAEADTHLTLYDGQTAIGSAMVGMDGTWAVTEPGTLSDGTHQISAATTNGSNVTSASSGTTTIVVDAHPAATTVTGMSAATDGGAVGDGLTNVAEPVILGTAEAGATVAVYDGATLLGATAAANDGSWMLQPTHALVDGPHTIEATASDLAGNVVASTMGFSLTIDTVAPTIAINAPIAGDGTIDASEAAAGVTISGTTTGAETNQPVNVEIVDASGTVDDTDAGSVSATGAWSVVVTAAQAQALADGSYTLKAAVSDKAGNPASEASQALAVDETRPGITAVAASGPGIAADGSGDLGAGETVTFTATTSEPVVVGPAADGSAPTVTFDDGGIATYSGPIDAATTSLTFSSMVAPGQNTVALQLEGIAGAADVTDTAGNPIDLSSLASAAFPTGALAIDTTAPTVPTSPTLTVAQDAGPTAIGIAAPSDNLTATNNLALAVSTLPTDGIVTLADGTTPVTVGEALTATQLAGLAFTPTPGAASQSSSLTYSVTDRAGNASQGSATLVIGPAATPAPTPIPTPDTISLDPNPAFLGAGTFLLTGAASSPAGVAAVEISARVGGVNGVETDLGAATLNPDGTFSFADHVGATVQGFITATETDEAGGTVSDTPALSLEAGLGGSPYAAREDHYAPDGSRTTSTLFRPDGSSTTHADGPGQTLTSNAFDIFANQHRAETTFVFDPGFGIDVVKGFRFGGPGHDVIDLPSSDFTGIADVLRHTGNIQGSAWITDPKTGDAIRFAGVTKAELANHPKDFAFHA